MSWSLTIGRLFGVAIRVHITFVMFLVWIGLAAFHSRGAEAALESVVYIVLIFVCVIMHEFGHILVARRYGIETDEVTLLPIGGVASLHRMPDTPSRELAVAIAGPLVNLVIAAALVVAIGVSTFSPAGMEDLANPGLSMLERLAAANLILALFNLIPAFPMDGGRVLHALISLRTGDARATDIAATIGQACAFGLGLIGLFGYPILLFVAIFVYVAAAEEAKLSHVRQALAGLMVGEVMETEAMTIPLHATLKEAVDLLLATPQDDFPLVDAFGKPVAATTRSEIIAALRSQDPQAPLPSRPAATIRAVETADKALQALSDARVGALCVIDAEGVFVGLLPRQALAEAMMIRAAQPSWRFRRKVT